MRPRKHETTGSGDLFRARLDQIINMRHELVQLAGKIDWDFIDGEIVGAAAGGESGTEGLARLLNAAEGTFEFRKSPANFDRTINTPSNVGLLLDLLRYQDEEANSLSR